MAIAVTLDFNGTLDQYDDVVAKMGFTPGGPGAAGGISHMVIATDGGFRVTDVWESREQFEAFGRDQIAPLTQQAGIMEPPVTNFYDVHNYLTKG